MSDDDRAITRSEEEHRIRGVRARPVGRVRLRKRIVTEYVDVRVPLRREELVVFEEDLAGEPVREELYELGGDELELVLHAEEPILESLQMRVVARERVRVSLDVVTGEQRVDVELAKEVVDVEQDPGRW